jgi:CysZ protein
MTETNDQNETNSLLTSVESAADGGVAGRLFGGLMLPLRAVRFLLGNPKLWVYVAIPALINIVLFIGSLYFLGTRIDWLLEYVWAEPVLDAWYDYLLKGIWYLVIAALTLFLSYIIVIVGGGIVASPFNDALSEHVEEQILPDHRIVRNEDESLAWGILRSIAASAAIMGTYAAVMVPVLLLNLLPGVGQVASTGIGAVVSAFFLTLEFTDATLDRRGNRLGDKVGMINGNRTVSLGFGLGSSLLMWVPFLNFLTIPIAVVAGTAVGIVFDEQESA